MSANNFYFAYQIGNKWYGWDAMAEAWGDHNADNPVELHFVSAECADSIQELEKKLDERGIGYSEYGITTQPYLPKDGTPIKVIL